MKGFTRSLRPTVLIILAAGVGACASNQGALIRESARFMSVLPESVSVSNVNRGATNIKWQASAPKKGVWDCSSDDMMRRPLCIKRDSTGSR